MILSPTFGLYGPETIPSKVSQTTLSRGYLSNEINTMKCVFIHWNSCPKNNTEKRGAIQRVGAMSDCEKSMDFPESVVRVPVCEAVDQVVIEA